MTTRRITSVAIACAVATLVLALVALASLAFGSRQIAPDVVWDALVRGGVSQDAQVVTQLRVPRTLAALVIGGALGLAGSIMQAMTRNPLADPGVLGINAGAAFLVVTVTAASGVATRTATLGPRSSVRELLLDSSSLFRGAGEALDRASLWRALPYRLLSPHSPRLFSPRISSRSTNFDTGHRDHWKASIWPRWPARVQSSPVAPWLPYSSPRHWVSLHLAMTPR